MADQSPLNTFDYQVALPIFPNIFFKVIFNCNGVITTSDAFNNSADALAWAQDELEIFGTWSVSDDVLYLTDSLCGVGSLSVETSSEHQSDEVVMELDDSNPQAIEDIFGIAAVDVSVNGQKALNTTWKNNVAALTPLFVEPITGTTAGWAMYKTPSDGYNIQNSEVIARGFTMAEVLDGVGVPTYGYGFAEDAIGYIPSIITQPAIIISINMNRPALLGQYTTTFSEIDYIIAACISAGITIRIIQLGYEEGISDNNDVYPTAEDIAVATQIVGDYITDNYPTIEWSIDANRVDDSHVNKPTLNNLMNTVSDNVALRQYFQFEHDLLTYEQNRNRIAEFPSFCTKFIQAFTNGQKMRMAQNNTRVGNPMRLKVGEGLIYSELIMNVIKQNILHNNFIKDYVQYNISTLVSGSGEIEAAYNFVKLIRSAFSNNGMIDVTLDNANLVTLGTKTGAATTTYILNPTSDFDELDAVKLNGASKNITVESYYGNPSDDVPSHYTASGTTALLYPHSLTKIITV